MEDERGAGGHDDDKNMSSENEAAEVFGEEDGEEIMVEVVGSDVYVDGVSGSREGGIEMGEAGDLEGGVVDENEESANVSRKGNVEKMVGGGVMDGNEESTNVSREGSGKKMAEGGVVEKIDINLSNNVDFESEEVSALLVGGVTGVDGEEVIPRIKATYGSFSIVCELPTEVSGASPMEICVEENTMDETINEDSSEKVRLESLNHHVEDICDEKTDTAEEK